MRAMMRSAVLTASASITLITSTAHASTCWYPNEAKAAQLRNFHIMLMVGALQCRFSNGVTIDHYNSFIGKQRPMLDANANVLKTHFDREAGVLGSSAYDQYSTRIANAEASRFKTDREACDRVDMFMRVAASASDADLLVLAQSTSSKPESGACPASNFAPADMAYVPTQRVAGIDPVIQAAVAPSPAAPTAVVPPAPADGSTVATAATAATAPGPQTTKAPDLPAKIEMKPAGIVPATVVAVAPPVAKTTTVPEGSMKAAIAALQAATVALQAAMAPPGDTAPKAVPAAPTADGKPSGATPL